MKERKKSANKSEEKRLPFSGEFSPGQVNLTRVLNLASIAKSKADFAESIRLEYFADSCEKYTGQERIKQQSKRAMNVFLGMRDYGLLEAKDCSLTVLGKTLLASKDELAMFRCFAAHIITEAKGR